MPISDLTPDNTLEDVDSGVSVKVNDDGELLSMVKMNLEQMNYIRSLLYDIKEELQKLNTHAQFVTGEEVEKDN